MFLYNHSIERLVLGELFSSGFGEHAKPVLRNGESEVFCKAGGQRAYRAERQQNGELYAETLQDSLVYG